MSTKIMHDGAVIELAHDYDERIAGTTEIERGEGGVWLTDADDAEWWIETDRIESAADGIIATMAPEDADEVMRRADPAAGDLREYCKVLGITSIA